MKLTAFRCCCIEIDTVFTKDDSIILCGLGSSATAFFSLHLQYIAPSLLPIATRTLENSNTWLVAAVIAGMLVQVEAMMGTLTRNDGRYLVVLGEIFGESRTDRAALIDVGYVLTHTLADRSCSATVQGEKRGLITITMRETSSVWGSHAKWSPGSGWDA